MWNVWFHSQIVYSNIEGSWSDEITKVVAITDTIRDSVKLGDKKLFGKKENPRLLTIYVVNW